jgi:hypothetical protein
METLKMSLENLKVVTQDQLIDYYIVWGFLLMIEHDIERKFDKLLNKAWKVWQ